MSLSPPAPLDDLDESRSHTSFCFSASPIYEIIYGEPVNCERVLRRSPSSFEISVVRPPSAIAPISAEFRCREKNFDEERGEVVVTIYIMLRYRCARTQIDRYVRLRLPKQRSDHSELYPLPRVILRSTLACKTRIDISDGSEIFIAAGSRGRGSK